MSKPMHHVARQAILGAIAVVAALSAAPAFAENPAQEEPCGIRNNDGPCRPDLYAARPQYQAPVAQARPWERQVTGAPAYAPTQERPWERLTTTRLQEIGPTGELPR